MRLHVTIALTIFAAAAGAQATTPRPLCVIDGVPIGPCPDPMTQRGADIVSVEVLKGPAAANKYGADAANGVVLIKTRNPGAPAADDPLTRFLFPPELVMAHQQEIGLSDAQRRSIQDAMKDAQGRFVDLQFRVNLEVEKLQQLVKAPAPDEAKAMEQLDRVLASEREVKRTQLGLLIRIKNQLTAQQQTALAKLR